LALRERRALLLDALERLRGGRRLFFGGGGDAFGSLLGLAGGRLRLDHGNQDLLAALRKACHILADFFQAFRDGVPFLGPFQAPVRGRLDGADDGPYLALYLGSQGLDFRGALFRRFGQRPHLVRDDREASAVIAGARGLDRGIEREKICLVRNMTDGARHVLDVGGLRLQFGDDRDRRGLTFRARGHTGDRTRNLSNRFRQHRLDRLGLFA